MSQPPAYNRDADFTKNHGSVENDALLNAELDDVSTSINAIRTSIATVIADDGGLKSGIVTKDNFTSEAYDELVDDVTAEVQPQVDIIEGYANTAQQAATASAESAASAAQDAATSSASAVNAAASASSSAQTATNIQENLPSTIDTYVTSLDLPSQIEDEVREQLDDLAVDERLNQNLALVQEGLNQIPQQVANAVTAQDIPGQVEDEVDAKLAQATIEGLVELLGYEPADDATVVKHTEQTLTDAQKAQARTNINAARNDIINVKDFGAKGDGVTDDTTAIQAALTAGVGKSVVFPTATYVVSSVSIPDGVAVVDGCGSTLLRNTANANALVFDNAEDLTIQNFIIKTTDDDVHGGALKGRGIENVNITNIRAISQTPYDGGYGDWAVTLSGEHIRMSDIFIDTEGVGQWGDGIHLGWVKDFSLENFDIHAGDDCISVCQHPPMTGAWIDSVSRNIIIGNGTLKSASFSDLKVSCVTTYAEGSTANYAVRDMLVHDVVFAAGSYSAFTLNDSRSASGITNENDNIIFSNSIFNENVGGSGNKNIAVTAGKTGTLKLSGCTFIRQSSEDGYYSAIKNVDNLIIEDCSFSDISTNTSDFYFDSCGDVVFKGNIFRQTGIGRIIYGTDCDSIILSDNIISAGSGTSAAVQIGNLTSAKVGIFGNVIRGATYPFAFTGITSISELLSSANYFSGDTATNPWSGALSLENVSATKKILRDVLASGYGIDAIVETGYQNNVSYVKYASGLLEQWGAVAYTANAQSAEVNLPVSFVDSSYAVSTLPTAANAVAYVNSVTRTTSKITFFFYHTGNKTTYLTYNASNTFFAKGKWK